ncbi:MAG: hypothetical protein K8J31_12875, partial [Anaerolineae bacterium]|nr:hypothetical protein [Anaerolineae bacterium]
MAEPQPGVYELPIRALLPLGAPTEMEVAEWPDYVGLYGFTPEHVPELCRLMMDETFMQPEYQERPEAYAFIHAVRALGQLRGEAALSCLIGMAETETDNDWLWDEIPNAVALIGPTALPRLKAALERTAAQFSTGLTLVGCLEKMAELHPEARDECVAILVDQLKQAEGNDEGVNGSMIGTLVDWRVMDALPVIEQAYATDNVDLMVTGDWDDVQVELGLKEPDPNKTRRINPAMQELLDSLERMQETHDHAAR